MATWRYIKGSEEDFQGAPDWATVKMEFEDQIIFEEHQQPVTGVSRYKVVGDTENVWDIATTQGGEIIAQRERVTSVNDDRLVQALITERGSRYGKFADGADIMQQLKDVMRKTEGWTRLTNSQREALDMIQHKIGRALNGDPTYDDNWKDIAGYATLVAEELNGVKK